MLKIILIFSAYLIVKYAEQYFDFFHHIKKKNMV